MKFVGKYNTIKTQGNKKSIDITKIERNRLTKIEGGLFYVRNSAG